MIKKVLAFVLCLCLIYCLLPASAEGEENGAIPIRVLILPKFEVGGMTGDTPGEAQYYYEAFLAGGEEYDIAGGMENEKLFVKDGVALYICGEGKVNAALSTMAVLSDQRFDFSNAYILSTGCAGSADGSTVMGDVFVITAAVDYDLGHHADIREMTDQNATTWFHDDGFDSSAFVFLNPQLTNEVYRLVQSVPLETTERTRNYMSAAFDGAEWAVRDPKVQRGTTVTGDNYWKGIYDEQNARLITETYGCPDPFAVTEMEEVAVAVAVRRMGLLDRLIILRCSVNMAVFVGGTTPETLWSWDDSLSSGDSVEGADIFPTAMKNIFEVGRRVIDAILADELGAP